MKYKVCYMISWKLKLIERFDEKEFYLLVHCGQFQNQKMVKILLLHLYPWMTI